MVYRARQIVPGFTEGHRRRREEEKKAGTSAYPGIDDAFHSFGVCLPGELWVLELGFHRERHFLEPLQEFVLLTCSEVRVLRAML